MSSASFRLRKTPAELEIEFSGESEITLQKFDENLERILSMKHVNVTEPEKNTDGNGQPTERRTFKKTGEQKIIREHLAAIKKEDYFKQPRQLGEIRGEMRTRGWFHDPASIQYCLLHNTVELGVKRISEGKNYKYVEL